MLSWRNFFQDQLTPDFTQKIDLNRLNSRGRSGLEMLDLCGSIIDYVKQKKSFFFSKPLKILGFLFSKQIFTNFLDYSNGNLENQS